MNINIFISLSNNIQRMAQQTRPNYDFDLITDMICDGKSWEQIGTFYGRNKGTVWGWYKRESAKRKKLRVKEELPVPSTFEELNQSKAQAEHDALILHFENVVDTRGWSWSKWCIQFLGLTLFPHQEEILDLMDNEMMQILIHRQGGKSSVVLRPFILRKLCESVFCFLEGIDKPILYISTDRMCTKMSMSIRFELLTNPRILAHYGSLIDRRKAEGLNITTQDKLALNLLTKIDTFLVSFMATTPGSMIRGNNVAYCVIDDIVDFKQDENYVAKVKKITDDMMEWFNYKILPLIKHNAVWCGTRFGIDDVFARNLEMGIYTTKNYPVLIGDVPTYTIPERESTDPPLRPSDLILHKPINCRILAPKLWETNLTVPLFCGTPLQNIMFRHYLVKEAIFSQEYMNNPIPRSNILKIDELGVYQVLPHFSLMRWVIFMDPASGKTASADYTSITLVGKDNVNNFYIADINYGHYTGKEKLDHLEKFYKKACTTINKKEIPIYLEVVRNMDFYYRVLHESKLRIKQVNPKDRGEKEERILHNFGTDLENGLVRYHSNCRNIKRLKLEIESFPFIHPDVLDNVDQADYYLRFGSRSGATRGF